MCGYLFVYSKKKIPIDRKIFLDSSKLINHRGPDDFSSFFGQNIAMGFYRLSIRDLSIKGRQPMLSFSKKKIIVFNGEIYNSKILKNRINSKKLLGSSDTEILINYYEKFQEKGIADLKGMFSFVVFDFEKNKCFLARDRFGIKPLYYFNNKDFLIVSSEIKPILKFIKKISFNESCFSDFFLRGYMDHGENTFFNDIKSLPPANYKVITRSSEKLKCYWDLEDKINKYRNASLKVIKKKLTFFFNNSIKEHLISDTEIGICLSGGNDSSSIASKTNSLLNYKLKTFTYEFENQINKKDSELYNAKKFSEKKKMDNFPVIVDSGYIKDNFDNLILNLESPITSIRLFGIKKLYEEVRKQNVKVMLEGYGGDEMLGGYDYNYMPWLFDQNINKDKKKIIFNIFSKKNINHFGIEKLINQINSINSLGNFTSDGSPYLYLDFFNKDFLMKSLFSKENFQLKIPKTFNYLKSSQFVETKCIHIPRALKYVDRLSMISGVESRVPFLDHELFEFCFNLDNKYKIKNFTQRWIWKNTFKNLGIGNKKKKTITDPQKNWFKTVLKENFEDEINSKLIKELPYFNQKNIKNFYNNYKKRNFGNSFALMQILSTLKFIRLFKNL